MSKQRVIVIGGGLAGLSTVMKIAEGGVPVDLFSIVPVKRSHSVCAQGGINAAVNTKGEGDSPWEHFDDSIYGGDFLANQPPVKGMCEAGPAIVFLLDRMGVPFNRTPEGLLDFRRFGGTKHNRTAFAGATTGQQMLYALDEQVRRHETEGLVTKYEMWEFLSVVLDEDRVARGIVALNLASMEIRAFRADAVVIATGGVGMIFGRSTNSVINTGSAVCSAYRQGAFYANGEFVQIHPTAIPGEDKLRLISESCRGEGGRVWVPKDPNDKRAGQDIPEKDRWHFLEEWYPAYANLVPRDVASRAIYRVVFDMKMGIGGEKQVYLDLTHIPARLLDLKLKGVLEIYEKFMGKDPRKVPMRVFPAVHYTMGGMWVDYDQMTNVKGLFAVGECDYQYHGANRLGANSLLSCIYGGLVCGPAAVRYIKGLKKTADDAPSSLFDVEKSREDTAFSEIYGMDGTENPYRIWQELGDVMTENVTVVRHNDRLKATDNKVQEFQERWKKIKLPDKGKWANPSASFTRQLWNMLELARVITLGALARDESRGSHFKPEFEDRNDEKWLVTTKAKYAPGGPIFSYEPVDTSFIKLRTRKYDTDKNAGNDSASASAERKEVAGHV
ncbi:MAG: succinate dehydrogenase flavoprotein subunit [Armatimonadetes bacterium]|nr:succinate dehydrogenase flavoprotein subunit [Armatimonadota bacterium]